MKVENYKQVNIPQIRTQNKNKGFTTKEYANRPNPNFTGTVDTVLRFLDTNQAWGANAVDFCFMVTPRTLTDFTRGADAGFETARREGAGTTNHSLVGAYGLLAGLALATGINKAYNFGANDVKASDIFADSETLNAHGKIWNDVIRNNKENPLNEHLTRVLNQYEALSATENGKFIKFKDADIKKAVDILEKEITSNSKKMSKQGLNDVRNILISSTGVENNLRLIAKEGPQHTSRYTIDSIIENTFKLGKVFNKEKVKEAFLASDDIAKNVFLKTMKKMNVKRSLIGVGIATAFGMAAQPLNIYITQKKTGKTGFVGGGSEDKSLGFKARKTLAAGLFTTGVMATIGKPQDLMKNLLYKGFTPTIKQFKFIYGLTIMSRFLAARNDNELRETTIKDTLGFASWLILGNFIQKIVAQSMDKSLIKKDGEGTMNWIKNSVLKTRDEVLHSALGEKIFKDGKTLKFSEMLKELPKNSPARKQLRILTIAQLVGYAYSALALGFGIPRLNIFITNKIEANKKAKASQNQEQAKQNDVKTNNPTMTSQATSTENMLKPENIAFLSSTTKQFAGNFGK